jgi:oligosaccharide repeat unit polymerase
MVSFGIGCLLSVAKLSKRQHSRRQVFTSLPWLRLAILTLLALNTIGFALFAAKMANTYGFQTYFTDPRIIRADAREWSSFGALGALTLLSYPLVACSLVHILDSGRLTWLTTFGFAVPALETYLLTDRLTLITFMACSFFIWIYHGKRTAFDRKAMSLLGTGLLCGLAYFLVVGGLYGKLVTLASPSFQYSTISKNSQLGLRVLDPYVYATGSFPTFQAAMNDVDHFSWGTQSLYPLARVLYGLGVLQRKPDAVDFTFYLVPIPFNNYTWLFTFYSDFGVCGVLLLPGLIGWFETRLYVRMREAPTLFSISGSSALAAATALTACGFVQYDFILWYFLLVMFFVSKKVCLRSNGSVRSPAVRALENLTAVRPT